MKEMVDLSKAILTWHSQRVLIDSQCLMVFAPPIRQPSGWWDEVISMEEVKFLGKKKRVSGSLVIKHDSWTSPGIWRFQPEKSPLPPLILEVQQDRTCPFVGWSFKYRVATLAWNVSTLNPVLKNGELEAHKKRIWQWPTVTIFHAGSRFVLWWGHSRSGLKFIY